MEQPNFKRLKCDDKEYIFNCAAFKMELKRAAVAAKKVGKFTSIEKFEEALAETLMVSHAAIKQWKAGRNGVTDIDRVKEIAIALKLKNYKTLLIEQDTDIRKDDTMNTYFETERLTAKAAFDGMVEVIEAFKNTIGYTIYDECGAPDIMDVVMVNEHAEETLKKARFDLTQETYDKLIQLYYEVSNTEPEDIEDKDGFGIAFEVDRLADAYFEELCGIMKAYLR